MRTIAKTRNYEFTETKTVAGSWLYELTLACPIGVEAPRKLTVLRREEKQVTGDGLFEVEDYLYALALNQVFKNLLKDANFLKLLDLTKSWR